MVRERNGSRTFCVVGVSLALVLGDLSAVRYESRPVPSLLLPRSRRSSWSTLLSILLHGAVIGALFFARWQDIMGWEEILDPGTGKGRSGGGGGGGSITVVALPAVQRSAPVAVVVPVPPPVIPVPTPEVIPVPVPPPVEPVIQAAPIDTVPPDSVSALSEGRGGTGSGGGRGSGTGPGDGSGVGPGSGSGTGGGVGAGSGRATPPQPRQVILPPFDYPKEMRGQTFAVTFWVGTDGRVARVAVEPAIKDRGFAKRFAEVMRNYRFRPARSAEGTPIPGTTTVTISF
jgi:protein TonB